jgi:BolA family transcriptional regulator, general stress-responsive regulator
MRKNRINDILEKEFSPEILNVYDDSDQHIGHSGARAEGETHYRIEIRAQSLEGKGRVQRERAVMASLQQEFETGLHALQVKFI